MLESYNIGLRLLELQKAVFLTVFNLPISACSLSLLLTPA